ncbi:MAG: hypothetical protein AAGI10_02475 [Pseudomonadota bacterium]
MNAITASALTVTKTRLREGVWEGVVSGSAVSPQISVTHLENSIEGVKVEALGDNQWTLRVPIPASALSDGVQTFLIQHAETGATLGNFAIAAGAPLSEDLRAEVDLLRAELDMLKRAFRRHCVETGA